MGVRTYKAGDDASPRTTNNGGTVIDFLITSKHYTLY